MKAKTSTKNEFVVKGNRTVRMPTEIETWLIEKAKQTPGASVPGQIKDILIERYQAEKQAA